MYLNFIYLELTSIGLMFLQKKVLVTFHEQLRILQFNNQNLHNANVIHIKYILYVFIKLFYSILYNYLFIFLMYCNIIYYKYIEGYMF